MRQEMKVGFAIGGVLLAVLVVYVLVVSGHDKKSDGVALDTGGPAVSFPADHADQSTKTDASKASPGKTDTVKPTAPESPRTESPRTDLMQPEGMSTGPTTQGSGAVASAAPANDPWSAALSTGKVPTLYSQTPTVFGKSSINTTASDAGNLTLEQKLDKVNGFNPPRAARTDTEKPATQPAESASSDKPRTHTVQSGETFSSISQAVYGSTAYYPHILRANPNVDPKKLKVGTVLTIPPLDESKTDASASNAESTSSKAKAPAGDFTPKKPIDEKTQYVVQSGDSLYRISVKLYGKADHVDKLAEANAGAIGAERRLKVGQVLTLPEQPTATH